MKFATKGMKHFQPHLAALSWEVKSPDLLKLIKVLKNLNIVLCVTTDENETVHVIWVNG